jgi:hypothetical protein
MGISGPNLINKDDGIIIKDRRQLLVKVGSFMKSSWRRSTDKITDLIDDTDKNTNNNDDNVDSNDNDNTINTNRRRRRRRNDFFVQFDDEVYVIPIPSSCSSFDTCSTRNNTCNDTCNNEEQITQTQTKPISEPKEDEEEEEPSSSSSSWYQSDDYCKFKKDMILNSLNYINAKRAKKKIDEEKYSIRGIEHMCSYASGDPNYRRRQTSEKKYLYKVIRDEQNRQQKLQQQKTNTNPSYTKYDMDKFRSVSLTQTKNGRDRAISLGNEYSREQRRQQQKDEQQKQQQRNNNNNNNNRGGGFTSSPSMKNIFLLGRQIQTTI